VLKIVRQINQVKLENYVSKYERHPLVQPESNRPCYIELIPNRQLIFYLKQDFCRRFRVIDIFV
jgi:hypothetical protein